MIKHDTKVKKMEDGSMNQFYQAWLFKAERDLESAHALLHHVPPLQDNAIYFTQQCAEKALKGFLSFHRQEIYKTHNLGELIEQCSAIDLSFDDLFVEAESLTPNVTEYRYPDDYKDGDDFSKLLPTVEDTQKAIETATVILEFVKQKIERR